MIRTRRGPAGPSVARVLARLATVNAITTGVTLWVGAVTDLGAQAVSQEREANIEVRTEWLESQRAYPGTAYLQNPVYAARAAAVAQGFRASAGAFPITSWRSIGPFGFLTSGFYGSSPNPDGGRIRAVAIHPTNPNIVYAGAASGGVWRSLNGGATWTPLTDAQCSLNTGSIAIDPVDPRIIYVGTGEPTQSNGCGLLRSFDSGDSWTEINGGGVLAPTNGTQTTRAYRLRVDRSTAGSRTATTVLYAATNGLHRSTNSGTSWTTVLPGLVTDLGSILSTTTSTGPRAPRVTRRLGSGAPQTAVRRGSRCGLPRRRAGDWRLHSPPRRRSRFG